MDIREHYISSFFLHLIALLLVFAFSQSYFKEPDTLAVSLSSDSPEQSPPAGPKKAQERHEIAKPMQQISKNNTEVEPKDPSLPEEVTAPKEPASDLLPEKLPEAQEPAAAAGISDSSGQEAMLLAQMHHVVFMETRAFIDNFSQSFRKNLLNAIESDRAGSLSEETAEVTFYFNGDGGIGEIWGATNSQMLESALNHLDWQSIPLPGTYRLKLKGLRVGIRIENGEPTLSFTAL